jgi:Zn-dependent protease/CBS domain-containing protein
MFGKSISLIKLFGFEVKLDLSWLILGLLITWTLAQGVFPYYYEDFETSTYWLMGIGGAIGLLVSIVFHELWHSLIARRFGLPMKGITLFIFGGVAEMSEEPPSPKAEFFMSAAGPLSSIILGGVLFGIWFLLEGTGFSPPILGVINYLAIINLILAGFNLLPAFPLDGGRILRSILWAAKDNLKWATQIASKIGNGFGVALMLIGIFSFILGNIIGGVWMFVIGLFLRGASQSSYQQLLIRRSLEGEPVRKFMKSDPVTVSPSLSLEDLVEDYVYKHHYKLYPVTEGDDLKGCVTINQIKEVPKEERAQHTVGEIARSCSDVNTISPDEDSMNALQTMHKQNTSRLMVVDNGHLVGVIALKDIMEMLSLKMDLEG